MKKIRSLIMTTLLVNNFVNRRLSSKDSVGALKDEQNVILSDNSDKAELLNNYFGSVCTVDDGKLPKVDKCAKW